MTDSFMLIKTRRRRVPVEDKGANVCNITLLLRHISYPGDSEIWRLVSQGNVCPCICVAH